MRWLFFNFRHEGVHVVGVESDGREVVRIKFEGEMAYQKAVEYLDWKHPPQEGSRTPLTAEQWRAINEANYEDQYEEG